VALELHRRIYTPVSFTRLTQALTGAAHAALFGACRLDSILGEVARLTI
jgi:hypothetical protein